MKTILIVISGMADLPDPVSLRDTPLSVANIPSLKTLANRGDFSAVNTRDLHQEISYSNSLLAILGYDLQKGSLSIEELREFGLDNISPINHFSTLQPFIIPGFSGHGVCITTAAWVRGIAKCALLTPLDIYSPGASDIEILEAMAELANEAIIDNEFVFIYIDSPLRHSLKGNYDLKVDSLEKIDRYLITPVADFVWKSDLMINLAITTDLNTPWHTGKPVAVKVPVILYFNNNDAEAVSENNFTEVESLLKLWSFESPGEFIRYLCNFSVSEEEENSNQSLF